MTDASKTVWLVQADTATVGVYSSREQAMTERTGNEKAYEVEVDTCQIVPQTEWIVRFDLRSGEELEWVTTTCQVIDRNALTEVWKTDTHVGCSSLESLDAARTAARLAIASLWSGRVEIRGDHYVWKCIVDLDGKVISESATLFAKQWDYEYNIGYQLPNGYGYTSYISADHARNMAAETRQRVMSARNGGKP